jgi:phospholipid N-methyltransferase
MSKSQDYIGSELELFLNAKNWKKYWVGKVRPLIKGPVLEVGAGIGANTKLLHSQEILWHQLEPDTKFYKQLKQDTQQSRYCEAFHGTLKNHPKTNYQTIIYIDVLEHIEYDGEELKLAANKLKIGGKVIVLSPAHQSLMSNFDRNIGHFRRYNKKMLRDICPINMSVQKQYYLDSVGLLASFAARFVKSGNPKLKQILFWDRLMVPLSRLIDPLFFFLLGKTIITVYEKK